MPILSLQNVTKDYLSDGQRVRALDGISLEVSRGEFVALVGRSGCGKSTLLNLAGAMDFPTSGQVLLDGVPTSSLKDAELTQLRRAEGRLHFSVVSIAEYPDCFRERGAAFAARGQTRCARGRSRTARVGGAGGSR